MANLTKSSPSYPNTELSQIPLDIEHRLGQVLMNPRNPWGLVLVERFVVGSLFMVHIVQVAATAFAEDIRIVSWRYDRDGSRRPTKEVAEVVRLLLFSSGHR